MATPFSRRSVLAAGAGAAVGLTLPGIAVVHDPSTASLRFRLDARTLDGGEQVTSVTLDTARLGPIDPASLSTATFTVHAKATSPIPIAPGDTIFSEYDLERPVTAVRLDHGVIVLDLSYAEGQIGGGTLGYIVSKARNVRLDLTHTITQTAPFRLRNGHPVTITSFVQGRLANPEVDAFSYHISGSGMKYRLYSPTDAWKATYRARAGIEGTISQTVAVTGIRDARYTGLPKLELEHAFAATAINLIRLYAWWTETPLTRTRITHLARLNLDLAA